MYFAIILVLSQCLCNYIINLIASTESGYNNFKEFCVGRSKAKFIYYKAEKLLVSGTDSDNIKRGHLEISQGSQNREDPTNLVHSVSMEFLGV